MSGALIDNWQKVNEYHEINMRRRTCECKIAAALKKIWRIHYRFEKHADELKLFIYDGNICFLNDYETKDNIKPVDNYKGKHCALKKHIYYPDLHKCEWRIHREMQKIKDIYTEYCGNAHGLNMIVSKNQLYIYNCYWHVNNKTPICFKMIDNKVVEKR